MKVLKILAAVVVVLVALFFIISFFLPDSYRVERSIEINADAGVVYSKVINLKEWDAWSPWAKMDPNATYSYAGTDGEVNSSMTWNGELVGIGTLTIVGADSAKSINTLLEFKVPFESTSNGEWKFETMGDKTKVTWANAGKLEGTMMKYFGLSMEGMLGPDYEKGLKSLKNVAENVKKEKPVETVE